jgi:hypothetical protein
MRSHGIVILTPYFNQNISILQNLTCGQFIPRLALECFPVPFPKTTGLYVQVVSILEW